MDLSRAVYSRDLKIAAMRALDTGATNGEIARKYQLSPHLLERWRGEWRAKGDLAFPGTGRRGAALAAVDDGRDRDTRRDTEDCGGIAGLWLSQNYGRDAEAWLGHQP